MLTEAAFSDPLEEGEYRWMTIVVVGTAVDYFGQKFVFRISELLWTADGKVCCPLRLMLR